MKRIVSKVIACTVLLAVCVIHFQSCKQSSDAAVETVTVCFDAQGGTLDGKKIKIIRSEKSKRLSIPSIPVREHYSFAGWYTDKNGTGQKWDYAVDKADTDIILYAH